MLASVARSRAVRLVAYGHETKSVHVPGIAAVNVNASLNYAGRHAVTCWPRPQFALSYAALDSPVYEMSSAPARLNSSFARVTSSPSSV